MHDYSLLVAAASSYKFHVLIVGSMVFLFFARPVWMMLSTSQCHTCLVTSTMWPLSSLVSGRRIVLARTSKLYQSLHTDL